MSVTTESTRTPEEAAQARLFAIAHDLAETAKRECSREDFFRAWLSGVLAACGADSGLVIETTASPPRTLATLGGGGETGRTPEAAARREQIRRNALERREFVWVREEAPVSLTAEAAQEQATLIGPLPKTEQFVGLVELTMSAAISPARQRGCLNFVVQSSAFIEDFLLRERVRSLSRKNELSEEAIEFVRAIHARADLRETAYAVANEGRRLVRCDRVTVLRRRGRKYQVLAVSGQDTFDARSPEIKALVALASSVAAGGRPLSSDDADELLPPPLEQALSDYVDESHVKSVAVIPLMPPPTEPEKPEETPKHETKLPLGVLVFERRTPGEVTAGHAERVHFVVDHATSALANALEQQQIFLLSLWRAVGKAKTKLQEQSARRKVLAGVAAAGIALAALLFVRTDFALHASATFQPVERRNIFAPLDGTVTKLLVKHGEHVDPGKPLLELRNTDLEVTATEARGERTAAAEQLASVERALFGEGEQLTAEERVRLSGQRSELTRRIESLDEKLQLLDRKRERLKISSPIGGEVITWNIERLLRDRPVQQGQTLLTVADTNSAWELEVYLPEHYVGHMVRAQRELGGPLQVRFRPTSDPASEFVGTIKEIDETAEVRGDHGNTVLVTVAVDPSQMPQLKPGVEASAKVICGRRSLGYVWLHDVADFVRAKILFRLY